MSTKLTKKVIDGIAPVTLAECVYIGDGTTLTLKDKLSSLPSVSAPYQAKYTKWVSIGDSITYGGWGNEANKILNIPTYINLAVSGTTLHNGNGFIKQATLVEVDTDLGTIMGSTNNMSWFNRECCSKGKGEFSTNFENYDMDTFIGSYQKIIETLYQKNPKIKIILITAPRAFDKDRTFLKTINSWTKEVAEYYGLPCIDSYNLLGINTINKDTFHADNLHFNSDGNERLGEVIAHQIMSY